jgi:hypothetical protein
MVANEKCKIAESILHHFVFLICHYVSWTNVVPCILNPLTVFVRWWQQSSESGDRLSQVWIPQVIAPACDSPELWPHITRSLVIGGIAVRWCEWGWYERRDVHILQTITKVVAQRTSCKVEDVISAWIKCLSFSSLQPETGKAQTPNYVKILLFNFPNSFIPSLVGTCWTCCCNTEDHNLVFRKIPIQNVF